VRRRIGAARRNELTECLKGFVVLVVGPLPDAAGSLRRGPFDSRGSESPLTHLRQPKVVSPDDAASTASLTGISTFRIPSMTRTGVINASTFATFSAG